MGVAYKDDLKPEHGAEADLVRFLNYAADLESNYGLKILSSEAKLLRLIKNEPGYHLKHYILKSGLSIRWFNVIVDQLINSGLVIKEKCNDDDRSRRLS